MRNFHEFSSIISHVLDHFGDCPRGASKAEWLERPHVEVPEIIPDPKPQADAKAVE